MIEIYRSKTQVARAVWAILLALTLATTSCGSSDDSDAASTATDTSGDAASTVNDTDDDAAAGDTAGAADDDRAAENTERTLVAPVDTITDPVEDTDPEESDDTAADAEPRTGGTLRVAVEAESDGLNPAANNFAASAYVMTLPVVEPLAYWDTDGNWTPYLAESFTKIGDGFSWQMKLREGINFHDGTELDADDVIATFKAQLADPIISQGLRPTFSATDAVEKIDDYTVQYTTKSAYARFPSVLTNQLGMVLPSEWVAKARQDSTLDQMPVGTGPFMIESRVQDEKTVLVRNPDYWAADTVDIRLNRIEIYPITDAMIAAERLAADELDLIATTHPEAILTLRDAAGVTTRENQRTAEDFAILNTQIAPFDDIRARQAITFAAPQDAYVKLIGQGATQPANTMFHPDLVWYNPDVVQETDMPDRAGPLVKAYCADHPDNCTGGKINMELQYSGPSVTQTRIADLLIDGWQDYFNVTRQELPQDTHILQVALGQFNAITWRQFGEINPDIDIIWMQCEAINRNFISLNWPRYCDEQRDALMLGQLKIEDIDQRVEMWQEIQQITKDAYTYIFFTHANWTIGAADNIANICGQISPGTGTELFCNNQGILLLSQIWLH